MYPFFKCEENCKTLHWRIHPDNAVPDRGLNPDTALEYEHKDEKVPLKRDSRKCGTSSATIENKEAGLEESFFSSDECHALCGMEEELGIKLSQGFSSTAMILTQY